MIFKNMAYLDVEICICGLFPAFKYMICMCMMKKIKWQNKNNVNVYAYISIHAHTNFFQHIDSYAVIVFHVFCQNSGIT